MPGTVSDPRLLPSYSIPIPSAPSHSGPEGPPTAVRREPRGMGNGKGRRMLGPSLLVSYSWPNIPFPSPCHLSPYSLVSFTRLVVYATRLTHSTRVTERGDKGTE